MRRLGRRRGCLAHWGVGVARWVRCGPSSGTDWRRRRSPRQVTTHNTPGMGHVPHHRSRLRNKRRSSQSLTPRTPRKHLPSQHPSFVSSVCVHPRRSRIQRHSTHLTVNIPVRDRQVSDGGVGDGGPRIQNGTTRRQLEHITSCGAARVPGAVGSARHLHTLRTGSGTELFNTGTNQHVCDLRG